MLSGTARSPQRCRSQSVCAQPTVLYQGDSFKFGRQRGDGCPAEYTMIDCWRLAEQLEGRRVDLVLFEGEEEHKPKDQQDLAVVEFKRGWIDAGPNAWFSGRDCQAGPRQARAAGTSTGNLSASPQVFAGAISSHRWQPCWRGASRGPARLDLLGADAHATEPPRQLPSISTSRIADLRGSWAWRQR